MQIDKPHKNRAQADSAANRNGLSRRQWKLASKAKREQAPERRAEPPADESRKAAILAAVARFKASSRQQPTR